MLLLLLANFCLLYFQANLDEFNVDLISFTGNFPYSQTFVRKAIVPRRFSVYILCSNQTQLQQTYSQIWPIIWGNIARSSYSIYQSRNYLDSCKFCFNWAFWQLTKKWVNIITHYLGFVKHFKLFRDTRRESYHHYLVKDNLKETFFE